MSTAVVSIELPEALLAFATAEAERHGTSIEQWLQEDLERRRILQDQTEEFFRVRRERAIPGAFQRLLDAVPDAPPMPGDELE